MGKLQEMSDGNYILEAKVGCMEIRKSFKDSDTPLEEVSQKPMQDGFYLHIPDMPNGETDK